MLASPPCFFVFISGLAPPVLLFTAAFLRLLIRVCLPKSRATHSPRDVVIPGLFLSCGTEVAPRLPDAGTRNMQGHVRRASPHLQQPCCGLALGSLPLCGQSQGSGSNDLSPFSYTPYRIPTRSWCGPPWAAPVFDRRSFWRHPRRLPLRWLVPGRQSRLRSGGCDGGPSPWLQLPL